MMVNHLLTMPEMAEMLDTYRASGEFIPAVVSGKFAGFVNRRSIEQIGFDMPLSAEDFVLGMELLGWRFYAMRTPDGPHLCSMLPRDPLPPSWAEHEARLTLSLTGVTSRATSIGSSSTAAGKSTSTSSPSGGEWQHER